MQRCRRGGCLPNHPRTVPRQSLAARERPRAILQRVDLVLVVGTDPFEELFYWGDVILPLDARLVHIGPSPGRIGRSEPTDVGIVGHCASALADLAAVLMERWSPGDRSEIEERRQAVASEKRNNRENFDKAAADRWDHKPMSPARMMLELTAAVPDNAVVVDDSISNRGAMRHYSRPPAWGTCVAPGARLSVAASERPWAPSAPIRTVPFLVSSATEAP